MDRPSRARAKGPDKRASVGAALNRPSSLLPVSSAPSLEQEGALGRERHIGPPRTLNVWDFASERAAEISSLNEVLKSQGGKGLFTLARHLRRRTTSHSRRQFLFRPKKQKVESEKELEQGDGGERKPQSRKVRRRAMLQAIKRGEANVGPDGDIRLETHVWHAKRFVMEHLWGHVLAAGLPGRGRGSRSVLRAARFAALVHDATYVQPIQLEGPRTAVFEVLESVSSFRRADAENGSAKPGNEPRRAGEEGGVLGSVAFEVMLHKQGDFPLGAIAPATLMWRPQRGQCSGPVANEADMEEDGAGDGGLRDGDVSMAAAPHEEALGDYIPLEGSTPTAEAGQAVPSRTQDMSSEQRIAGLDSGLVVGRDRSGKRENDPMEEDEREGFGGAARADEGGNGEAAAQCLVWVHAAAFDEALGVLQGACAGMGEGSAPGFPRVRCRSRKGEFVRLDVMGAETRTVLSKVLRPIRSGTSSPGADVFESDGATWQRLVSPATLARFPPRAVLSLTVEDPRHQHEDVSTFAQPELVPSLTEIGPDADLPPGFASPLFSPTQPTPNMRKSPSDHLLQSPRPTPPLFQSTDVRPPSIDPREKELAPYAAAMGADYPLLWDPPRTPDGKPLWPKPVSNTLLGDQRRQARLASFGLPPESPGPARGRGRGRGGVSGDRGKGGEAESNGRTSSCCPVWLVQRPADAEFAAGWTLIVPSGWALPFWVPLIYAGAHAVGQRERNWVVTEAGTPVFPDDYPDCPAYARTWRLRHQKLLDEYAKKPPAKRPAEPPPLPNWDSVCSTGAREPPSDQSMGGQAPEASARTSYFVARDRATLATATGVARENVASDRDRGRRTKGVRQGLKAGKLTWKAVGSVPEIGALPREPAGGACCLVEALLKMPRKGVPEEGAEILVPTQDDFDAWCKSRTWQGVELPRERGRGRGNELAQAGPNQSRPVMGYVISPSPPSGSAQSRAFVVCQASTFQRLRARQYSERAAGGDAHVFVLVHNCGSNMGRPGLLSLKLDQE
ncbi:hypothetical protein KFL_000180340 [Klebsormidium nitens]|uniref:Uncharacterized protein n=1 Tax=Klebsormidium nitens TaxID=105231 RepID=A0A1Y1HP50_KLENI|nr:hypothetical protein KFL_000180340 [Klebsormidium nitens]|eukprot:GAQ78751.1 hypothetical protein KFL_000180340 [Klebsormidium nitens]